MKKTTHSTTPRAATYVRSATRNPTSLETQRQNCAKVLAGCGAICPPSLRFEDPVAASHAGATRPGYASLLSAWHRGDFDILIVDDPERLSRDYAEREKLQRLIDTTGVRILTATGGDSTTSIWRFFFAPERGSGGMSSVERSHRIRRGLTLKKLQKQRDSDGAG